MVVAAVGDRVAGDWSGDRVYIVVDIGAVPLSVPLTDAPDSWDFSVLS